MKSFPSLPRVLIATLALSCASHLQAQAPAAKAPAAKAPAGDPVADAAYDAFLKLRNQSGVAWDAKRFDELLKAGLPPLAKYPKHRRAGEVIGKLTDIAQGFNDKTTFPQRDVWFSKVKMAVLNVPEDGLTDDSRAALAALQAANACAEARLSRDKDTVETAREKVDSLATMPGGMRFLADQEMNFVEVLKVHNPPAAEKQVKKLMEHADKGIAGRAGDELRIMEIRKAPFELKFTNVDGKAFDAATLRGKKALYIFFWSADHEGSVKSFEALKEIYFEHRERIEIVAVNLDSAENRAKVDQVLKDTRVKWPQMIEGMGGKSETAARVNVRSPNNAVLVDQRGWLALPRAGSWQIVGELRRMGFKF